MTSKGKPAMDKKVGEEDIKGLEEEIDSAINRLFVEKRGGRAENEMIEPDIPQASYEIKRSPGLESSFHPQTKPLPLLKILEKMETQLLSLEWEITRENLEKTKEEVLALRETFKDQSGVTSVLNLMGKVLDRMMKNDENIRPPLIKYLLDSNETIKLLVKKETDSETNIYKQLAQTGIEARFSCLEGAIDNPIPSPSLTQNQGVKKEEITMIGEKKIGEMLNKMNLFSERMDEIFKTMDQYLLRFQELGVNPSVLPKETRSFPVNITILKVDDQLFGIESDRVVRLFKLPRGWVDKFSNHPKIRIRDIEAKRVDLKRILSIPEVDRKGEGQILIAKGEGEYKAFIIDQVLKKLTTQSDIQERTGEYFSRTIRWSYQEQSIEIPVLDLNKI